MRQVPTLLINGACSPLGQALASQAAGHFRVALADRDSETGNRLCEQLHANGSQALFLELHAARRPDMQQAMERLLRRWQQLDVLVNLVNTPVAGPFEAINPALWQQLLNEQLLATINSNQSAVAAMKRRGSGQLINVIHEQGLLPTPLHSAASMTGAAILALSESLNAELHSQGINVSVVASPTLQGVDNPVIATDPLSRARLRREQQRALLSPAKQAEQILAVIGSDRFLSLDGPSGSQWRRKRWRPVRWLKLMRERGHRLRR